MTGSTLDLGLVLVALVFGLNGYRQGFVVGVLSFLGFFGGALVGVQVAPAVIANFEVGLSRVGAGVLTVFALAVVGQTVAVLVGSRLRDRLTGDGVRVVDSMGGAAVSAAAVLLVAWMVAAPLASSPSPWLASQVRRSAVVRAVDQVVPGPVRSLYSRFGEVVDRGDFPEVFGRLTPTEVRAVQAPDPRLTSSPAVSAARRSTVKVLGEAPGCNRRLEGTGFVYARERVMTNAHVVAGVRELTVELGSRSYRGRVVLYDPRRDLAVLAVPGLTAPALRFAPQARSGTDAIVVGYPLDGPYTATPARVRDVRPVRGPDIYGASTVTREVYTLRSAVRSGNSGGPLLAIDGTVYGVIFAAAVDDRDTGFALTAREAATVAAAGRVRSQAVSTQTCD